MCPAPDGDDGRKVRASPGMCSRDRSCWQDSPACRRRCFSPGRRGGRRTSGSGPHSHLLAQILCRDHAIPPGLFGDVESLVSALDELGQWFDRNEFGNADRHRHPVPNLCRFCGRRASVSQILWRMFSASLRAWQPAVRGNMMANLLATVADCGILPFDVLSKSNRHHPEDLITDLMPELVVELLEVIDVDQQQGQGFALFRGAARRFTQHAVEHLAIAEAGQSVHQRFATRSVEFPSSASRLPTRTPEAAFPAPGSAEPSAALREQAADDLPNAGFALPNVDLVRRTFQELLVLGRTPARRPSCSPRRSVPRRLSQWRASSRSRPSPRRPRSRSPTTLSRS